MAHDRFPGGTLLRPIGRLLAHMCRACGFTQMFASDPGAVPVGPEHKTFLIKGPEPEGPYR